MHCKDTILRTQNNWPYSKLIPNSGILLSLYKEVKGILFSLEELSENSSFSSEKYLYNQNNWPYSKLIPNSGILLSLYKEVKGILFSLEELSENSSFSSEKYLYNKEENISMCGGKHADIFLVLC